MQLLEKSAYVTRAKSFQPEDYDILIKYYKEKYFLNIRTDESSTFHFNEQA